MKCWSFRVWISTAKGVLVNITGESDMTLFEVDKAAQYVTQRVNDQDANSGLGGGDWYFDQTVADVQ
jgi:cell division GTPase FtsZ